MLSGTLLDAVSNHGGGMGFVVLDEDLMVRHANGCGLAQLGLCQNGPRTSAAGSDIFGELRQQLLRAPLGVGPRGRFSLAVPHIESGLLHPFDVDVRAFRSIDGRTYYLLITSERGERKALDGACASFDLSAREIEVARLICAGQTNADISRELGIAQRTVENHLRSIYAKAGVNSRTQLVSQLLGLNCPKADQSTSGRRERLQ